MKKKHLVFIFATAFLMLLSAIPLKSSMVPVIPQTKVTVTVGNYSLLQNCNASITLSVNGFVQSLPYNGTATYVFWISGSGSGTLIPGKIENCNLSCFGTAYSGTWNWMSPINLVIQIGQEG